jgi:hypothetical protein
MAKFPIIVERFSVTISIPFDSRTMIVQYDSIYAAEEAFSSKYEKAQRPDHKVNFDRARALMKWGASCNAELTSMKRKKEDGNARLHVTLTFSEKGDLDGFIKYLNSNVDGSTRKY